MEQEAAPHHTNPLARPGAGDQGPGARGQILKGDLGVQSLRTAASVLETPRLDSCPETLIQEVTTATREGRGQGDLISQVRRASISVAATIAKSAERGSDRDFV
jgi:hypothetical protein